MDEYESRTLRASTPDELDIELNLHLNDRAKQGFRVVNMGGPDHLCEVRVVLVRHYESDEERMEREGMMEQQRLEQERWLRENAQAQGDVVQRILQGRQ